MVLFAFLYNLKKKFLSKSKEDKHLGLSLQSLLFTVGVGLGWLHRYLSGLLLKMYKTLRLSSTSQIIQSEVNSSLFSQKQKKKFLILTELPMAGVFKRSEESNKADCMILLFRNSYHK